MRTKTHAPETRREKDTGPAVPRTRCGRELYTVDLCPVGGKPSCRSCARE